MRERVLEDIAALKSLEFVVIERKSITIESGTSSEPVGYRQSNNLRVSYFTGPTGTIGFEIVASSPSRFDTLGLPAGGAMPTLDRAALLGRGLCADVYAWGDGRVLKLFHAPAGSERAHREFAATRAVHSAGLPVPAVDDVIEVEGRLGIVFERIEGPSLLGHTQARPWKLFAAVRLAAALHADIHRYSAPAGLPSFRERILARIEESDASAADKQSALQRLASLPDGTALCHGDFHPDNILLSPRGPVVIDWSSASRGHPIGDVAWTSRLMRTANLPPWSPWFAHLLLRSLRPAHHRTYLRCYFGRNGGSRREVENWQGPLTVGASGTW
jgi:tRNA A-37 threonylcarbamoyl transferase component Bud32